MYIRLTSRCNMTCEHCCYSCTMDGEDMSIDTFHKAIEVCEDMGEEYITLGGGEPTMHPKFWEILGTSFGAFEHTFIITNGSNTDIAMKLLRISNKSEDLFGVELSRDMFHDPIDEDVVDAYVDARKIRDITRHRGAEGVSATGRAAETGVGYSDHCVCDSWVIEPNGTIKFCGCDNSPNVGNVHIGIGEDYRKIREGDWENGIDGHECWNKYLEFEEEQFAEAISA